MVTTLSVNIQQFKVISLLANRGPGRQPGCQRSIYAKGELVTCVLEKVASDLLSQCVAVREREGETDGLSHTNV